MFSFISSLINCNILTNLMAFWIKLRVLLCKIANCLYTKSLTNKRKQLWVSKITCTSRGWILGNKELETATTELAHKRLRNLKFLRCFFDWSEFFCFGGIFFVFLCCCWGSVAFLDIKSRQWKRNVYVQIVTEFTQSTQFTQFI